MTVYEGKQLISYLLMIFGIASILAMFLNWNIPNVVILGVVLLSFGYQLSKEAELDELNP